MYSIFPYLIFIDICRLKITYMRRTLFFTIFILCISLSEAQHTDFQRPDSVFGDPILTPQDEALLLNVPRLRLSQTELDFPLPSSVNNAESDWMIPIFYQTANECGQASTICYTLSYELMRRRHQHYMWGYDFCYPSHFAWNMCNNGYNHGVSFMESWEVIRTAGTPTVNEWGGWYSTGGAERWISGYDIYHSAMKNRISEMYAIPIDNEEGLLTLKHWLSDHLNGEPTGGLANFYCTYRGNDFIYSIPSGSPQAGKHLIPNFASNVNHAKTIVGYDDEVRWDYNGDGQFTNNIDINNDGVINLKDWEIGAVIFCNTFGTNFGDGGYCYLPYCKLASLPDEGGIWNKCVYVVQVKDEVFPQITYKATIRHTSREKIKLTAGVANSPNATAPEHTLEFHVFNYQGGDLYMQGGTSDEDAKTLELGLDVSPLLNYIEPNTPCTFFFNVTEKDPQNNADGAIVNFSLMDYTSGSEVEQACTSQNVSIANNTTTTLSVVRAINFSKPAIQDSILPDMHAFTDYRYPLHASDGKPSYRWELSKDFEIEELAPSFPSGSGQSVSLSNSSTGYAIVPIGFDFPYCGDTYSQLIAYADGYIAFHHQPADWPFLQSDSMQTMAQRLICPFKCDLTNCTIQKIAESDCLTLIFSAKVNGQSASSVNFAVKLFKSGNIEFHYGNMTFTGNTFWSSVLRGDQQTIQHTPVSGHISSDINQRSLRLTPSILPAGVVLSADGVLSGKSTSAFEDRTFSVTCYDNNDIKDTRKLHLSCIYESRLLITDMSINGNHQSSVFAGDTMRFTISIQNLDTLAYTHGKLRITSDDPMLRILDSTEYFGYIGPNNEYTLNECVSCVSLAEVPEGHIIPITFHLDNDISPVSTSREFTVHHYDIQFQHYAIHDYGQENALLNPIELDSLIFTFLNNGQAIRDLTLVLRTEEPGITIAVGDCHFNEILTGHSFVFPTILYISPDFNNGNTFELYVDFYSNGRLIDTKNITIFGETRCLDFEDGQIPANITNQPNQLPWVMDRDFSHSGRYSLRSGNISHNDTCSIHFPIRVFQGEEITFFFKTSTENKYDWLCFLIDNELVGRWSGVHDWTFAQFPLTVGEHVVTWQYLKDVNTSSNSDCVWIDDICFPELENQPRDWTLAPEEMEVSMGIIRNTLDTSITISNLSDGILLFNNILLDENDNIPSWANLPVSNGFVPADTLRTIPLSFNSYNCQPGDYHGMLVVRTSAEEKTLPLTMHVTNDVGIHNYESGEAPIVVYPNPTSDIIYLYSTFNNLKDIALYNIYGQLLSTIPVLEGTYRLNLSKYPAGIYFLRLTTPDGEIQSIKIMKQ